MGLAAMIPSTSPITAAMSVSAEDSTRNWVTTERAFAPIAFRIPISRRRSRTTITIVKMVIRAATASAANRA